VPRRESNSAMVSALAWVAEHMRRWRPPRQATTTAISIAGGLIIGQLLAAIIARDSNADRERDETADIGWSLKLAGVPRWEIDAAATRGAERGVKLLILGYSLLCMNDPKEAMSHRVNCDAIFTLRSLVLPDERVSQLPNYRDIFPTADRTPDARP
jgi:hypothetical protein